MYLHTQIQILLKQSSVHSGQILIPELYFATVKVKQLKLGDLSNLTVSELQSDFLGARVCILGARTPVFTMDRTVDWSSVVTSIIFMGHAGITLLAVHLAQAQKCLVGKSKYLILFAALHDQAGKFSDSRDIKHANPVLFW